MQRKGEFPLCDYNQLLSAWGLKLKGIKRIRAILKVETDQGTFACKYFKYNSNLLEFIVQAIHHLKNNGFPHIMEIIPTVTGANYYQDENGNIFFLMPWISGKESNLKDKRELYRATGLMAQFHLAAKQFIPQDLKEIPNSWGEWPIKFQHSLDSLLKVKEIILNKDDRDQIDNIILHYWQDYYDLTARAIQTLKTSKYNQYVKKAKKTFSICHADFTYHNLLISPKNDIHLIDLDYLRCDTRTLDLGKFMRKELAHFKYDFEICRLMLRAYNEIFPLEKDEYPLLLAILLYPQKFMVNILDYYLKRKERPIKVILHRIRRDIEERYYLEKFLNRFEKLYL